MPAHVSRQAPRSPKLRSSIVASIAERMLKELSLDDRELSVLLTNDVFIHELNLEHRSKDRPTDVLAFPQLDEAIGELAADDVELAQGSACADPSPAIPCMPEENLLGDVVISLDTALRQAEARKHELLDEVRFLLAHGLLHLIGYDHQTDEEEAAMDARTRELVAATQS